MVHIVLVRALHIRTSKLQDSLTPFLAFGKQSIPNNHSEDSETFWNDHSTSQCFSPSFRVKAELFWFQQGWTFDAGRSGLRPPRLRAWRGWGRGSLRPRLRLRSQKVVSRSAAVASRASRCHFDHFDGRQRRRHLHHLLWGHLAGLCSEIEIFHLQLVENALQQFRLMLQGGGHGLQLLGMIWRPICALGATVEQPRGFGHRRYHLKSVLLSMHDTRTRLEFPLFTVLNSEANRHLKRSCWRYWFIHEHLHVSCLIRRHVCLAGPVSGFSNLVIDEASTSCWAVEVHGMSPLGSKENLEFQYVANNMK